VQGAIADIRRLVYGLRPPALDDLGLVGALQSAGLPADGHQPGDLRVEIEVEGDLADLPAAVEVAAFRIAQEALINVVRHARASVGRVVLRRSDALLVEVLDDGGGFAPDAVAGVGLMSMRERAEELGGTVEVGARPGGGTRVAARLPLPLPELPRGDRRG
jgi:two-component system, NarL family, sensor kinase